MSLTLFLLQYHQSIFNISYHGTVDSCAMDPKNESHESEGMLLTLPETNVAPENGWLEYYFPIGEAYFQGLC